MGCTGAFVKKCGMTQFSLFSINIPAGVINRICPTRDDGSLGR
jgi:hypothetical protein